MSHAEASALLRSSRRNAPFGYGNGAHLISLETATPLNWDGKRWTLKVHREMRKDFDLLMANLFSKQLYALFSGDDLDLSCIVYFKKNVASASCVLKKRDL